MNVSDELNQTTTLSKPRNSKSIKVNVDVQEIGDMKLHISNLLRGRTRMGTNCIYLNPIFYIYYFNKRISTVFLKLNYTNTRNT